MSINPLLPARLGMLVTRQSRLAAAVAAPTTPPTLTLPAVITSQTALTTVIVQRSMSFVAQVTWARTVDTTTDWVSSDPAIASVVVDTTDTTTATITANDDNSGIVTIQATANVGVKEQVAIIEVAIVAGGIPAGSILVQD